MSKRAVPVIRFADFSDVWKQHKFSEIFNILQNCTLSRAELSYEIGDVLNIHYGDVLIKYGEVINADTAVLPRIADPKIEAKYRSSELQDGDIIIADTAEDETVGKCAEMRNLHGKVAISGLHTIPSRPVEIFAAGYLGYFMNAPAYHDQLLPLMQGTKVMSVSKSALQDTIISFPSCDDEQRQIGQYFMALDNLITLHQHKLEKVQQIRQMLLKQLFAGLEQNCPEIRFKGNLTEWHRMSLRDIVTPYTDYLPTPTDGYTRLGIRSYMKGTFYDYVAPSQKLGEKRLQRVKRDNLIVNIVFAWEHAVAITTEEDEGKLVSHRFPQFSFNEGMHPMFFRYALRDPRFRHHLFLASPSGAGRNKTLRIDEMMDYQLRVPEYEEQKKIAGCLETVDQLIELYEMELEKIRNVKSACLQGMFV